MAFCTSSVLVGLHFNTKLLPIKFPILQSIRDNPVYCGYLRKVIENEKNWKVLEKIKLKFVSKGPKSNLRLSGVEFDGRQLILILRA